MITRENIHALLGETALHLLDTVANHAQAENITLYLVGGIVRDLLLKRRNLDIDFVLEGDAIHFAETLCAQYGGTVSSFKPFGTAKWILDASMAHKLNLSLDQMPTRIDFATARTEIYQYPTALPTTQPSTLTADLSRRDFTINTLALQISDTTYKLIDQFGGVRDLQDGLIRVLHNQSFIDDPTRILRAVRFEHRFRFTIEPQTAQLIASALRMLRRITGERVRNEITLILKENQPEAALRTLAQRGILTAIHDDFTLDDRALVAFSRAKATLTAPPAWVESPLELTDVYWHLLTGYIPVLRLPRLCNRLLFSGSFANSLIDAAQLLQAEHPLTSHNAMPSEITYYLEHKILDVRGDLALFSAWLACENPLVRERIEQFATTWRDTKPTTNGAHLLALGLKAGKCYGVILSRLRDARLDGLISTDEEEQKLLSSLIEENICD